MTKFLFYDDDQGTVRYQCDVQCQQCEAATKSGTRCKNKTCFSLPYCSLHVQTEYGIVIKDSTIPGAGKGIFALKQFKKNDIICPIWGMEKSAKQLDKEYGEGTAPYAIGLTKTKVIDGACHRYIGQLANTQLRADGQSSLAKSNAVYVASHRSRPYKLFIQASKKIKEGDEIFVYYGEDYSIPSYKYSK